MNKKEFYQKIHEDKQKFKIWQKLDNGCYIATMNYSKENAVILMKLLKSFEEQYGEEITLESAEEELKLYDTNGKTVNNVYFYGLSTVKEYRGKGACSALVTFAIEYAYYNDFDFVYARTDLAGSNSEGIMKKHGMQVCENEEGIIAEWVDVTDVQGDYRLHLWMPLKDGIYLEKKENAFIADPSSRDIQSAPAKLILQ